MTIALPGVDCLPPPAMRQAALSQWDTPQWLANLAASWAGCERGVMLEPSAGMGALVQAAMESKIRGSIVAHEIDPVRAAHLRAEYPDIEVIEGDFLQSPRPATRYMLGLLNPPYEGGLDAAFLVEAMARCDRVIAILRTNFLHGKDRYEQIWSRVDAGEWGLVSVAYCVSRPRFSGTVGSPVSDFIAIKMRRGYRGQSHIEWWHEVGT